MSSMRPGMTDLFDCAGSWVFYQLFKKTGKHLGIAVEIESVCAPRVRERSMVIYDDVSDSFHFRCGSNEKVME